MTNPLTRRVNVPVHGDEWLPEGFLSGDPDRNSDAQEVDNPRWISHLPDPTGPVHDERVPQDESGSSLESVRTISGLLDLMHYVEEEFSEWMERETAHGPAHTPPRRKARPLPLSATPIPSESWRGTTYTVPIQGIKIAEDRDDRIRIVVTNWGPGTLYLSHESQAISVGMVYPSPNMLQIPPPGPDATITGRMNWREFRSKDEIFAYSVLGTLVCDTQDEYGVRQ